MVSVTIKAVFLALFALPQVLAVPGGTVPRDNGWPKIPASIKDAALNKHNEIRANANVPPLSWSDDLQKKASARLAQCPEWADANSPENLGTELTVEDSIYNWGAGRGTPWKDAASRQVLSVNAKQVGCAIGDCSNPTRRVTICLYDRK